jgi:hypothetical protein
VNAGGPNNDVPRARIAGHRDGGLELIELVGVSWRAASTPGLAASGPSATANGKTTPGPAEKATLGGHAVMRRPLWQGAL